MGGIEKERERLADHAMDVAHRVIYLSPEHHTSKPPCTGPGTRRTASPIPPNMRVVAAERDVMAVAMWRLNREIQQISKMFDQRATKCQPSDHFV